MPFGENVLRPSIEVDLNNIIENRVTSLIKI